MLTSLALAFGLVLGNTVEVSPDGNTNPSPGPAVGSSPAVYAHTFAGPSLGLRVEMHDALLTATLVMSMQPSVRAAVTSGDVILAVAGHATAGWSVEELSAVLRQATFPLVVQFKRGVASHCRFEHSFPVRPLGFELSQTMRVLDGALLPVHVVLFGTKSRRSNTLNES